MLPLGMRQTKPLCCAVLCCVRGCVQTLEENQLFIEATSECQNQRKLGDCLKYLQRLHQNLLFLAAVGDCLPPPPPQPPPDAGAPQEPNNADAR